MSKQFLLSFFLIPLLWSCQNPPAETVKQDPVPQPSYQMPKALKEMGKFAEVTFTDTTELQQVFTFKEIDTQGKVNPIHFKRATQLYKELLKSTQSKGLPIFEINTTEKALLIFNGQGFGGLLWAKVLIDRTNNQILKVEFDQQAESMEYASAFTEKSFADQFVGKEISLDGNTFSLSQAGISGQSEVDGISGASTTSQSAIEMMNTGFRRYWPYISGR